MCPSDFCLLARAASQNYEKVLPAKELSTAVVAGDKRLNPTEAVGLCDIW